MNTETLHAITAQILGDVAKHQVPAKLKKLVEIATNRVNNPAEATYPQQFDQQITELRDVLPKLAANRFPPLWREYISEMNADCLIGDRLLEKIETVLSATAVTPTIALQNLKEIADDVEGDVTALNNIRAAFKRFRVGIDEPAPGTAEVGILIPRKAVHENLSEFGAELRKLSRIVSVFREAVHGDRPDVKLKTVASSEFSILCLLDLETAKLISEAVGRLIEGYKLVIGLKEKVQALRSDGVPDEVLKGVVDHANERMKTTVNAVSEEIVIKFPDGKIQETRRRELKIELTGALGEIASRIDHGFSFEVRASKTVKPKDGEEESPAEAEARQVIDQTTEEIASRQDDLKYLRVNGSPILSLPGLAEVDGKSRQPAKEAR